jgi:glycosyltransferase involved in cell wall biosynthesis
MKILQVVPFFPPKIGGVENHVYELVQQLQRHGHTVFVVTADQPSLKTLENPKNQKRLPLLTNISGKWGEIPICPSIFRALGTFRPDIVHVHTPPRFFAECTAFYFRFMSSNNIPLVVTYHLHNLSLGNLAKIVWRLHNRTFQRFIFDMADRVIICNSQDINVMTLEFGIPQEKLVVIPPGVNCNKFDPQKGKDKLLRQKGINGDNIILYSGRIHTSKGLDSLLQAVPEILTRIEDFKVIICGLGNYRHDLIKLAKELNVLSHVVFMDPVPASSFPSLLASCDVFVLPSLTESWGKSVAEALCMERPVVATRVSGVTEIVQDRKTGLIVEPGDVSALADAIIQLLTDRGFAMRLAKKGRKFVTSNFDWSHLTKKFLDLYEETITNV